MNEPLYLAAIGIGPAEIGILLVLLIFLFGPRRIPEIGDAVGKALKSFKKATADDPQPANEVANEVEEKREA